MQVARQDGLHLKFHFCSQLANYLHETSFSTYFRTDSSTGTLGLTFPVHLQNVQRCSWSHVGSSLWVSSLDTYWSCTSHCVHVQAPAVCGYHDAGWILQVQWPQFLLPPERHNTHTMLVGWILSKQGIDLSQNIMD